MSKLFYQKLIAPEHPFQFNEFFAAGKEESISPFLTSSSRSWAKNLSLKISLLSACLLIFSFVLSFYSSLLPLSNIALIFVYCFVGIPAFIHAIQDILKLEINIDVLMVLAAFLSIVIDSSMEGALLLVLFAFSGAMEESVMSKVRGTLNSLHKLSPTKAWVVNPDGTLIQYSVKDIQLGTDIMIKSGEIIPLDGDVIKGASSLDLAHLTGEHVPVLKKVGDAVPAGAHNLEGALVVKITCKSNDSTISRIIRLIREAQSKKPKLQRWFDKVSRAYAITIILLAFFFGVSLPYFISVDFLGSEGSIYRALAFLIAASPCALIIAVPIAYLSAISACARQGILLKGGLTLDSLAGCQAIAFDKTGTLTTGSLTCIDIKGLDNQSPEEIDTAIAIAAALERHAMHPIATAIIDYASQKKIEPIEIEAFKAQSGYGLEAKVMINDKNVPVAIGQIDFIIQKLSGQRKSQLSDQAQLSMQDGHILAALLVENKIVIFHFQDVARPEANEMLKNLEKANYSSYILSGDHKTSVQKVAEELAIGNYHSDLKPEDKLRMVADLAKNSGLVMVGDGVNDAPALARATVGIAMGKLGSTTAIDASDVVLLQDKLTIIPWLLKKAKSTQQIVKENVFLAAGIIVFISTPALLGWIPLWLAVVLHEGGTVLVGLNSLRLLKNKAL